MQVWTIRQRTLCSATYMLLLLTILLPSDAFSENYFSWNADSVVTSLGTCSLVNGASLDTTQKIEGSASMKVVIPATWQSHVGCVDVPIEPVLGSGANGDWLYYRWWMKIDPRFSWGPHVMPVMKSSRVKRLGDIFPPVLTLFFWRGGVYVGECYLCQQEGSLPRDDPSNAVIAYDFQPGTNPQVTQWQEYIVGIKKQSCVDCFDGQFHFWVNGAEIGAGVTRMRYCDSSNCETWQQAWATNMVAPYPQLNGTSADGGVIWLDDFSFDNGMNSRLGTPSASVPPAPPTNLRVLQ